MSNPKTAKSATPPPTPDPQPDPGPGPPPDGTIRVTVNQAWRTWIASLRPDPSGNVTFFVDVRSER